MDITSPREGGHAVQAESSSPAASIQKSTRSRKGCFSCRRRKVKCDEQPPQCRNCRIGDRQCHWPASDEIPKNKKRRHTSSSTPYQHPQIDLIDQNDGWRGGIANILDLIEHQDQDQDQDHIINAHAGPSTFKLPEPISSPYLKTASTHSTHTSSWSLPQTTLAQRPPPPQATSVKPEADVKTAPYMDADGFSDLLIGSDRQAEMMADSAFLQPYFPNVNDRLVMRHYLYHTVKVIMAFDSPRHPWNPWIAIHATAAFRHLPGVSPANDALRTAILAVGAVHLRYGHNRRDAVSAWRITHQARIRVLALVKQSNVWTNHGSKKEDEGELELVLAALLSCTIASSLAADDSWHELLTTVLGLIERLGGAQQILQQSPRDHMSLRRFVIEQLATRDVFGCMTTDSAPSILTEEFSPLFFEAERWSRKEREWESIESMFGISRRLVEIIARFCALVAKVRHYEYRISEGDASRSLRESDNINLRLPARVAARLTSTQNTPVPLSSDYSRQSRPPSTSEQHRLTVQKEANGLLDELKVWDSAYTFIPLHPRTQYGNHAYWHALRLRLLREVFRVSRDDRRVKEAVAAIMEISKEMLALYGRIVWMTWPILIAGFNMAVDDPSRSAALEFLCEFEPHACFDNAAACRTLLEFWKYNDGQEDTLPREVFSKLQSRPFLD